MPLILTLATVAYWIFVITSKPRGQLVLIFGLVPTLVAASMCSLLIIASPGWGSWGAWVDIFPGYLLLTAVNCFGCFYSVCARIPNTLFQWLPLGYRFWPR